ncbi:DUF3152 domain-containing protein [Streptomyces sp. RS2]|uniref:DUF3152 domain-containing protein n=1 Tax=Streptomyces sp. RS2 TaxID=1451205 RepID=UPI0021F8809F|nr:DUF3152 domain-containing protein [Streptomyces sp. RS2]MCW1096471.1 DUF3152 domain-containing protein [Streptomyces sp. RS2]
MRAPPTSREDARRGPIHRPPGQPENRAERWRGQIPFPQPQTWTRTPRTGPGGPRPHRPRSRPAHRGCRRRVLAGHPAAGDGRPGGRRRGRPGRLDPYARSLSLPLGVAVAVAEVVPVSLGVALHLALRLAPPPSTIAIPATGPGTFVTAQADGTTVGTGSRVRRYKVLVEEGIDVRPSAAAAEIADVLADDRGWTRDGTNSFRLVSSGSYDFVVKIATPGTVDQICGAAGLLTRGEVNCSVGTDVVVNLKRWVLGSPEFDGPIHEYRALIVNHEVGHRIGHGHETCPGAGRPAPAMMQQIKGLKGCVANAWPYDEDGAYLGGPSVP